MVIGFVLHDRINANITIRSWRMEGSWRMGYWPTSVEEAELRKMLRMLGLAKAACFHVVEHDDG